VVRTTRRTKTKSKKAGSLIGVVAATCRAVDGPGSLVHEVCTEGFAIRWCGKIDEGDGKRIKKWWREQGQGTVFQLPPEVTWKEEEYPLLRDIARKKLTAREQKAPAVGDRLRKQAILTNDKAVMDDCAALLNANRTRNQFTSCEPVAIGSKPGCGMQTIHSDCERPTNRSRKELLAMMKNVPMSCIRPLQDTRMPVYPYSHLPPKPGGKFPIQILPVEAVVPHGYAIFIHGWCLHCGSHLEYYEGTRSEVRIFASFAHNHSSLDLDTHFPLRLSTYYLSLHWEFIVATVADLERIEEYEYRNLRYCKGRADYPKLVRAMHWKAVLKERIRRFPDKYK
jgi:hypothetical protein